jgi:hypothetical protein
MLTIILLISFPLAAAEKLPDSLTTSLDKALTSIQKLALIRPEATGTTNNLSGLAASLMEHLSSIENLEITSPEKVFEINGPQFEISAQGIAQVATKTNNQAALFVRAIKTQDSLELHCLLISTEATVLLDKSFPIEKLPAPLAQVAAPPLEQPKEQPAVPPEKPDDTVSLRPDLLMDVYRSRRLTIVLKDQPVVGVSVGTYQPGFSFNVATPAGVRTSWAVVKGQRPINDLELAKLTGKDELAKQIEDNIKSATQLRNTGIVMTLAGFIAAGIATPYFRQGSDEGLTAAAVVTGTGLTVGTIGLFFWLIYGPEARLDSTHHQITPVQAEEMINQYNQELRHELGLPDLPPSSSDSSKDSDFKFSVSPSLQGAYFTLTKRF